MSLNDFLLPTSAERANNPLNNRLRSFDEDNPIAHLLCNSLKIQSLLVALKYNTIAITE
jgi:hypothetical protein